MFGANARLDVKGSFHVSTADYLLFDDGATFHTDLSQSSTLTVAHPVAFGFLGESPSNISVDSCNLNVSEGKTLSLIGGDIHIDDGLLSAPGGELNIASVASGGEVSFGEDGGIVMNNFKSLGTINGKNSTIETDSQGGGSIFIRGGKFVLDNGKITAGTGDQNGRNVDIELRGDFILDNSSSITALTSGNGKGGSIQVEANNLNIIDSTMSTVTISSGNAGNLIINAAGNVALSSNSNTGFGTIISHTSNSGDTGNIRLESNNLTLNFGKISLLSQGLGSTGNIEIKTNGEVSILGFRQGVFQTESSGIFNFALTNGNAGKIELEARNFTLKDGGYIESAAFGTGDAGNLNFVIKDNLSISGLIAKKLREIGNEFNSGIYSMGVTSGNGGNIELEAGSLTLTNGAVISTSTLGSGNAGDLSARVREAVFVAGNSVQSLRLANGFTYNNGIFSASSGDGNGGKLLLETGKLILTEGGNITTSTLGRGNAGDLTVKANETIFVTGNIKVGSDIFMSGISSDAFGGGKGGNVTLQASNMLLDKGGQISSSTFVGGKGGSIILDVRDLTLDRGALNAVSTGTGDAGSITINAVNSVSLQNSSSISGKSSGSGNAGKITVSVGDTLLSESSSVTTEAAKSDGGNINLTAQNLTRLVNSEIISSVGGGADTVGGNITMNQKFAILNNSKIIANAFEGKGGNIQITADVLLADPRSEVSASSAKGVDGEVDIRAPVTNISGNIAPLRENYSSAASLLLKPCAVRISGGERSSLVMAGRDGLPFQPGDLLPSPLYDEDMATADARVAVQEERPGLAYGANTFEEKGFLPLDMIDIDEGCSTCPQ
ncbi:MAG: hypothetical protein MRK02_13790 [Candidatus Scalindua sp.]|nr:hypothetical protein [Candidatus Scalindua sp.]